MLAVEPPDRRDEDGINGGECHQREKPIAAECDDDEGDQQQRRVKSSDRIGVGQEREQERESGDDRDVEPLPPERYERREEDAGQHERVKRLLEHEAGRLEESRRERRRGEGGQPDRSATRHLPAEHAEERGRGEPEEGAERAGDEIRWREHLEDPGQEIDVDRILVLAERAEVERMSDAMLVHAAPGDGQRVIGDRRFVRGETGRILLPLKAEVEERHDADDQHRGDPPQPSTAHGGHRTAARPR